jgi:hypothetical protein
VGSLKQINSAKPGGGGSPTRPATPRDNVRIGAPNVGIPQGITGEEQAEQQVVKAYVVAGDVSSNQEANAKINTKRTLG